ncbi:hypothetical protein Y032_0137g2007 [Ancylostoma ceylanicum]|uniref:Uncharacterized protein n=1 Tax=Ancylostoma ceylanicum TaxID=53326 RepID=A0A016T4Z8_9BILA|nr:hypothetical protein Y032_0137g2007 [Ancylostoma ceylanicum]
MNLVILQSFGVEALNKLLKLQKMGVVRERGGSGKLTADYAPSMFPHMKKQYDLLPENVSETNTSDSAYAYSGYAPLIVRILEEGDRVRWTGWHKTFDGSIGGEHKLLYNICSFIFPPGILDLFRSFLCQIEKGSGCLQGDDRTAVFVVGGATRAELAGIKLMPNVCLALTSSIITGNRLLDGITQI